MKALSKLIAVTLLVAPVPALAGIVDTPLPVLVPGKPTLHVYSVSGVGHWGGFMAAYFSCTSTDTASVQVGIEVFPNGGGAPANDAAATSLAVQPGQTVRFGTQSAVGLSIDSNLGAPVSGGSARILATSKKLVCTAFLADRTNGPPTSMVYLTVISKLKQKGE